VVKLLVWRVFAGLALVDWVAVARADRRTEGWAKPATLAALVLAAAVSDAGSESAGLLMLVALGFGLLGDIALLDDSVERFRVGLAAFLVGHAVWIWSFVELGLPRPAWAWLGVVALVVSAVVTRRVAPNAHRDHGPSVSGPIVVYTLVIGAMLICAWFTGEPLVAAGATIFVASDTTLSIDRFVRPVPRGHLIVMVTYHLGQALMVLGVLAALD
jgi:uncharacterized membrane protein YhhN